MRFLWVLFVVWASVAGAAGMRDSDELLTPEQLLEYLSGHQIEFYDASIASYFPDGTYEYRYRPDGPPFRGTYDMREASTVCTVFENGFDRCDVIVRDGARHVMIIETGDRFPIKSRKSME